MSRHPMRCPTALACLLASLPATGEAFALAACRGVTILRPKAGGEPGPVPANSPGCRHGVSLALEDGMRLWRCQVLPAEGQDDIPEGSPDHVFLLERPGRPMEVLPDTLMAGRLGGFFVARVDLDGDGRGERILAAWNGAGMGLGVNSWTIRVFDASWSALRTFEDVSEWGETSIVAAPRGRRGCDLAITAFVESRNRQGVEGISLQARFFSLANGRLGEAADRPAMERRYDFAFQRQRGRRYRSNEALETGDVAAWLSHPNTRPSPPR